jgi:hypothetical protein
MGADSPGWLGRGHAAEDTTRRRRTVQQATPGSDGRARERKEGKEKERASSAGEGRARQGLAL